MVNQLRFHPETARDLSAATAYYNKISARMGRRFRDAIGIRFKAIVDRPDSFGCIHDQQRAALVYGFPYVIMFVKSAQVVTVLGIFHAASDQSGWFTRSG